MCGEDEWSRGGEAVVGHERGTVGDARDRRSLVAQHGGADAALVTDAHGGDEALVAQLAQAWHGSFNDLPGIDRVEVDAGAALESGQGGDAPLEQDPPAHGGRDGGRAVVPLFVGGHVCAGRRVRGGGGFGQPPPRPRAATPPGGAGPGRGGRRS